MSLLVESIRIEDGKLPDLKYHQERMDFTRKTLFGSVKPVGIAESIPFIPKVGVWKCKILYSAGIVRVDMGDYKKRTVNSVALVEADVDYTYKYADRSHLDSLRSSRTDADDVLIVRNGLITDASSSNVAFFDGKGWFTPKTPLLAGTMRARLLDEGVLQAADIRPEDIAGFRKLALFNAMIPWNEKIEVETKSIISLGARNDRIQNR